MGENAGGTIWGAAPYPAKNLRFLDFPHEDLYLIRRMNVAYVPIPKDLTKVRQKLILNLTKRQVVCFSGGALIGVPLFFLTKNVLPGSMATFLMIFSMMPFFALGLYEKNGEPLEAVLRHIIESRYLRPRRRIYQTQNIYALLEKQAQLENEVKAIAQGNKQKAHRKRKAAD